MKSWVKEHKKLWWTPPHHPSTSAWRVTRSWQVKCESNAPDERQECLRVWALTRCHEESHRWDSLVLNTCVCEWKNDRSEWVDSHEKWEDTYIRRSKMKAGVCFAARESFILKCSIINLFTTSCVCSQVSVFWTSCFNTRCMHNFIFVTMHELFRTNRKKKAWSQAPGQWVKHQEEVQRGRRQEWIRTRQLLPIVLFSPFPFFTASLISPPLVFSFGSCWFSLFVGTLFLRCAVCVWRAVRCDWPNTSF